ncbi:MAG TPA: lipoate--protein ligase family protein [Verrucomicrobiae bacterium]|nr:lipoate--protein ligase family protein [Verrucomicrobiae bacterium]
MIFFDHTFPSPPENLACDEALLDWAESGAGHESLRFWESPAPFVVVGYANQVATEVNVMACEQRKIAVLRRCSGGGTVVQGPGCLNYALVLPIDQAGPLHSIARANQFIMRRNRAAIESAIRGSRSTAPISVSGHTDLAFVTRHASRVSQKKFSGNSQRRRKHFLLFHGTFLLNFDLTLISELLPMPSKQPHYRESRSHADFLMNLNASADEIKTALRKTWSADAPLTNPPLDAIQTLAREKYSTNEWNFKF